LTLFYNAFSDKDSLTSRESLVARLHSLEEDIDTVLSQRETLERTKDILEETRIELTDNLSLLTTERDELLKWKNVNLADWEEERQALLNKIKELQENINMLKSASSESSTKLQSVNEKIRGECDDLQSKKANLIEKKTN
jgi:chromosome segregation ATPase